MIGIRSYHYRKYRVVLFCWLHIADTRIFPLKVVCPFNLGRRQALPDVFEGVPSYNCEINDAIRGFLGVTSRKVTDEK